jgi:hypothetical protein
MLKLAILKASVTLTIRERMRRREERRRVTIITLSRAAITWTIR